MGLHSAAYFIVSICIVVSGSGCTRQSEEISRTPEDPTRWEEAISAFEEEDRLSSPPDSAYLFVGSSSIRLWDSLKDDMAPLPVIQRGFGGSRLGDAIYYVDRIIAPYEPKALVVFSGSNDIAGDTPRQPDQVVSLYETFVREVHSRLPDLPIFFIAISPTRSRWMHRDLVFETNRRIAAITETDARLHFIDTATPLLNAEGEPRDELFREDQLHLNEKGYALWTSVIKPVLLAYEDGSLHTAH